MQHIDDFNTSYGQRWEKKKQLIKRMKKEKLKAHWNDSMNEQSTKKTIAMV